MTPELSNLTIYMKNISELLLLTWFHNALPDTQSLILLKSSGFLQNMRASEQSRLYKVEKGSRQGWQTCFDSLIKDI